MNQPIKGKVAKAMIAPPDEYFQIPTVTPQIPTRIHPMRK